MIDFAAAVNTITHIDAETNAGPENDETRATVEGKRHE